MYGYDPDRQRQSEAGGCGDILLMGRVAAEILLPPMLFIIGTAGLLGAAFFLGPDNPVLAVLALLPVAGAIGWLVLRDRREQRERERDSTGDPDR